MFFTHNSRASYIHDQINLELEGVKIPFVKQVKLLRVIIDRKLNFDLHSRYICMKVNSKLHLLKKSTYLFDMNFKTILFKLFIQKHYDYCSTLFFHLSNKVDSDRLETSYSKALNKLLKIKTFNLSLI